MERFDGAPLLGGPRQLARVDQVDDRGVELVAGADFDGTDGGSQIEPRACREEEVLLPVGVALELESGVIRPDTPAVEEDVPSEVGTEDRKGNLKLGREARAREAAERHVTLDVRHDRVTLVLGSYVRKLGMAKPI